MEGFGPSDRSSNLCTRTNMSEVILGLVIAALLGVFGWYVREQGRERSKLINAILAKDSTEYVNRTLAEKTEALRPQVNTSNPDLIPMDQVNDEQFDAMIAKQLGTEVTDEEQV